MAFIDNSGKKGPTKASSRYCALVLVLLVLVVFIVSGRVDDSSLLPFDDDDEEVGVRLRGKSQLMSGRCDEIYEVREGETLHSISSNCGDPFILENNPHVNDPDDVFPGLLLKITPSY